MVVARSSVVPPRQFPIGDSHVVVIDDGRLLESTMLDEVFHDGGCLVEEAGELLARRNGYVRS
jgi:hypothetical protein